MNDNKSGSIKPQTLGGTGPTYLTLTEAAGVLAQHNIHTTVSQLRTAASPDTFGVKRLPFFLDPVSGAFLISEQMLLAHYARLQAKAVSRVVDWIDDGR